MKTTVTEVIDGDTFDVNPGWKWNDSEGNRVRPTGYDAPEINSQEGIKAKQKLEKLIKGKEVELKNAKTIDRSRLVCDVHYQGKNLADYSPEYKV
jgi:endonuclease YncB( thermonuclease family)